MKLRKKKILKEYRYFFSFKKSEIGLSTQIQRLYFCKAKKVWKGQYFPDKVSHLLIQLCLKH